MSDITPPDIWTYERCNAVNTDGVNMKEYKPTGQFYTDAMSLVHLFGLKAHPVFREPAEYNSDGKKKEPCSVFVSKYRLDNNSMKVLFKALEGCPHI